MSEKTQLEYCKILGTNINVTDMEETVQYLEANLQVLKGNYICVSNVHTTVMAYRSEEYRKVQNSGAMALPDGKPLSMVSRMRGHEKARRVPGPDLMVRMFEESKEKGYRHYFLGSTEKTLGELKKRLQSKYPYLKIAGMYSPPFRALSEAEDSDLIKRINETSPDFVWVALGAPKQEKWMYQHQFKINSLMLGVGAAFDFSAGTVRRAPKWMQELCLEWLYRILQDPVRLIPRYVSTNWCFLWEVNKENRKVKRTERCHKEHLKIAMIGHKRIPTREGGVEIVVNELSTRMVKKGHYVDAYNRRGSHVSGKEFVNQIGKEYQGVRIITIPTFESSSLNAIVYSFFASIRALFGRYDVVHYHAEGPCTMLWIPRLFKKRIVATIHGLDWQRAKWGNLASKVLKFREKMAVKCADEIIVLSANMQEYFEKTYARKTVLIPNGINRPEIREAAMIKDKYGLDKDEYILFLARIVPEKGLHYLIEAYQDIATDKKLVIAGGNSHSGEYVNQIKRMAETDKRIIMTDFVCGQCLEELYSNAYLYILPSDVEGMALSLLEAMSYGNCCLVSDIKENTEVIGDYGITFQKGNVGDLKERITELLSNRERVMQIKQMSSDYICKKYNWDRIVDETIQVYRGDRSDLAGK